MIEILITFGLDKISFFNEISANYKNDHDNRQTDSTGNHFILGDIRFIFIAARGQIAEPAHHNHANGYDQET
jgi:hypothetical protein